MVRRQNCGTNDMFWHSYPFNSKILTPNILVALKDTCGLFYSGTRISMTLCSLCAAIPHGHWCTCAGVLFGQYCQKGAIEKSPCSPSLCPWRSTCCWNQKESSTEPPWSRHWHLPSRIHEPLWGARAPGTIPTQPCVCVPWLASLQAGLAFTASPGAALFPYIEKPQLQAADCTGEAELEKPLLQTHPGHTLLCSA